MFLHVINLFLFPCGPFATVGINNYHILSTILPSRPNPPKTSRVVSLGVQGRFLPQKGILLQYFTSSTVLRTSPTLLGASCAVWFQLFLHIRFIIDFSFSFFFCPFYFEPFPLVSSCLPILSISLSLSLSITHPHTPPSRLKSFPHYYLPFTNRSCVHNIPAASEIVLKTGLPSP